MSRVYFTVTGTNYYYGNKFFEPKMMVELVKEPENKVDKEAIRVELPGLGKVGYVANSPYTVMGESMSAGRIYDRIGEKARGTVLYVVKGGILCYVNKKDLIKHKKSCKIGFSNDVINF